LDSLQEDGALNYIHNIYFLNKIYRRK